MTDPDTMVAARRDPTRRNVLLLSICLGLAMTGSALVMTVSALTGQMLADDKSLATLPFALQWVLTMAATIPASLLMRRVGRKIGFTLGQGIGIAAAVIATYAIFEQNFWLFAFGSALFGIHNAFWQYYRFAAADTASEGFRSKAISYVMAGGVLGAFAGPEIAKHSRELFEPVLFAGSYAMIVVLCLIMTSILQFIDIPRPSAAERRGGGRPVREIARQPAFLVAVLAATFGYATMTFVMTATPLAMIACGHVFTDAAFIIQWHVLAMYLPSFFTGYLIGRFGVLRVILAGTALMIGCVLVNLSGVALGQFGLALVLLGLGWNFMFVGGTTLLTETYALAEKAKIQAVNDFVVFGVVAAASLSSGAIQHRLGWEAVNYAIILPVLTVFAAALWLHLARRRAAAA